jgi:hypothetical protein
MKLINFEDLEVSHFIILDDDEIVFFSNSHIVGNCHKFFKNYAIVKDDKHYVLDYFKVRNTPIMPFYEFSLRSKI